MNKPVDDIQVGEWVIITAVENSSPQLVTNGAMGAVVSEGERYDIDGRGYQVRAISQPFILLWCPLFGTLRSLDLRRVTLADLDAQYVRVLSAAQIRQGVLYIDGPVEAPEKLYVEPEEPITPPKKRQKPEKPRPPLVRAPRSLKKSKGSAADDS